MAVAEVVADRVAELAAAEERRRAAARALFRPPLPAEPVEHVVAVATWRDALARAARCGDEELAALFRLADVAGDDDLARAVAAVAFDRGLVALLDAFAAAFPGAAEAVADLVAAATMGGAPWR